MADEGNDPAEQDAAGGADAPGSANGAAPPAATGQSPQQPAPASAAPETGDSDLARQLEELREAHDRTLKDGEVKNSQIARLHQELDGLRNGANVRDIREVLLEMISLYDDIQNILANNTEALLTVPRIQKSLEAFEASILESLRRHDVDIIEAAAVGDVFDRQFQRVLSVIPTDEADKDGRVARKVRAGFRTTAGTVLREEQVDVYRRSPPQ